MEAIILAAGEGSRMGNVTKELPKIFLEVNGKPLYQHQIEHISAYCDRITFILGYGFEDSDNPRSKFQIDEDALDIEIDFAVVDDWKTKENGYSALVGLQQIPNDDVLLLCGDVIFSYKAIDNLITTFQERLKQDGYNSVGVIEGIQDEMTAVRWNEDQTITKYGAIEGHQEAGMFVLHSNHVAESRAVLKNHQKEWFPVIFERTPSKPVFINEQERHETNTPEQLQQARAKWSQKKLDTA